MKIGVIGTLSNHVRLYQKALEALFPGGESRISYGWNGDAPYDECELETLSRPEELIGLSDAVIVTLRNGMEHAQHGIGCLRQGKPVFVDKPFALLTQDALSMLHASRETGVPLLGGSALCYLPQTEALQKKAREARDGRIEYWSDPFSPYGGWPFYGSHSTDLCAKVFGASATEVAAVIHRGTLSAKLRYPMGTVTLETTPAPRRPIVEIGGQRETLEEGPSFTWAMKRFTACAEAYAHTGAPLEGLEEREKLLFSVTLMEGVLASVRSGEAVRIGSQPV